MNIALLQRYALPSQKQHPSFTSFLLKNPFHLIEKKSNITNARDCFVTLSAQPNGLVRKSKTIKLITSLFILLGELTFGFILPTIP